MPPPRFLTAAEAAAALGVRPATLYAYVSRGRLRSEPDPRGKGHRYAADEVAALAQRVAAGRDPRQVARGALAWGEPVLDTRLTLIAGGRLYYRGLDAAELAGRGETLERVAALLWMGRLEASLPPPAAWRLAALPRLEAALASSRSWRPFQRMQTWLPLASAADPGAYDLRPGAVVAAGAWLLQLLAALAAGTTRRLRQAPSGTSAAALLARVWAPPQSGSVRPAARRGRGAGGARDAAGARDAGRAGEADGDAAGLARWLDAALVLSADHELNVSAFTARCVASAGAPPHAAVAAGLAALGGSRHGGQAERVEALLSEVAAPPAGAAAARAAIRERLAARLRRGEEIPGFGQPLYPDGDPRARLLLQLAADSSPASPHVEAAAELAAAALELLGERPNLDFGLVTLARALELPAGAPLALFAVGRCAGWLAHVLEQYGEPGLIRPRARYVGPDPEPPPAQPAAAPS